MQCDTEAQVGAMVHGSVGDFGYEAGVFSGEGANAREAQASKAYVGRASYGVGDALEVAVAVSSQPTGAFDGGTEVRATAYALDAYYGGFREEGLRIMAEAMMGDNPLLLIGSAPRSMMGAQVAAGWFMGREGRVEGLEPVLRVSYGDPDTDVDANEGVLLTPGVNVYFSGRNRLMVNTDSYLPSQAGLDPQYSLKVQFQIYF